jgi:hypothetical protein
VFLLLSFTLLCLLFETVVHLLPLSALFVIYSLLDVHTRITSKVVELYWGEESLVPQRWVTLIRLLFTHWLYSHGVCMGLGCF